MHERVGEEARELFEGVGGGVGGLLRVDAGGGEDAGEAGFGREVAPVGKFERAVHRVGAVADADGEDGFHAGGVGATEDVVTFGVVIEV